MNSEFITTFRLIVIAATLALPACSKTYSAASADIAARVNHEEIIVQRLDRMGSDSASALPDRTTLDQLIDQELLAEKARETGIDRDPAVIAEIAAARQRILAHRYVEQNTPNPEITAGDIDSFYAAHPAMFGQRKIYHFKELLTVLDADHLASFRAQADGNVTLEMLATWLRSQDLPVRELAAIKAAEQIPDALWPRVRMLPIGQIAILAAPDGVSAIQLIQVDDAPLSLNAARPAIENSLLEARRQSFAAAQVKQLRARATIEYLGSFATTGDGMSPPANRDNSLISKGLRGLL